MTGDDASSDTRLTSSDAWLTSSGTRQTSSGTRQTSSGTRQTSSGTRQTSSDAQRPRSSGDRRLSEVGRLLGARRDGVGPAPRPWGDDAAGLAFERRYRPVEAHVLAAWEQLAQYVEGLGDAGPERP